MNGPIKMLTLGLVLALWLVGGPAARAQGTNGEAMVLQLHKARVIDLQDDARDVLLSNPDIAEVILRTKRRVYLLGKSIGVTNVYFFNEKTIKSFAWNCVWRSI